MIFCNVTDYKSYKLVTGTNTFPKKWVYTSTTTTTTMYFTTVNHYAKGKYSKIQLIKLITIFIIRIIMLRNTYKTRCLFSMNAYS